MPDASWLTSSPEVCPTIRACQQWSVRHEHGQRARSLRGDPRCWHCPLGGSPCREFPGPASNRAGSRAPALRCGHQRERSLVLAGRGQGSGTPARRAARAGADAPHSSKQMSSTSGTDTLMQQVQHFAAQAPHTLHTTARVRAPAAQAAGARLRVDCGPEERGEHQQPAHHHKGQPRHNVRDLPVQ